MHRIPATNKLSVWLTAFLLFSATAISHAQQFGGNPPNRKWRQIDTDSLRVLFPQGYEKQAARAFSTSLHMLRDERSSIGNKSQKFNITLQPETATSNGFVALAPFRSVFMTTPPPDNFSLGTLNWVSELSIHETWHGLQNMNFRTGLGKTFHTLFGDFGQSFATHVLIPGWFWEGDAVFMETSLTHQGRGRLPAFMAPYKALWLTGKHYSYAKIRNGSLKDIVPNQYSTGYMTVAYGRNRYGYDFWKPVLQETLLNRRFIKKNNKLHPDSTFHLFKYDFFPLDAALRYHTGKNIKHFYYAAKKHFRQEWLQVSKTAPYTDMDTLKTNTRENKVLNYRYPVFTEDGNILVFKQGYARLPEIISIHAKGEENTLVHTGRTPDNYFSYASNKITWAEYRPDSRWGWKDYTVIRLYDMKKDHTTTLSRKSRYFSPALSKDGEKIIAVEETQSGSGLVLLDTNKDKILQVLPNPHHYTFTYPVFGYESNTIISGAKDSLENMALIKIDLKTNEQTSLTPFAPKAIGPARVFKDFIYFTAAYRREIQIYALRKKDNKIFKVANRPMGDYSLDVNTKNNEVILDEYAINGFQLLTFKTDTSKWHPVSKDILQKVPEPYVSKALSQDDKSAVLHNISIDRYTPTRYNPLKHLFNFHSWSFVSAYPETGLALQSLDLLGTLQTEIGGGYNFNEEAPFAKVNLTYGGLFPLLHAGAKRTFNRSGLIKDSIQGHWDEMNWNTGFSIPLDLSGSLYSRKLSVSGSLHQSTLFFKESEKIKKQKKSITYYSTGLSFNLLRNRTVQDINPKFGLAFSLQYNQILKKETTAQITTDLNLFLPGISQNHSLYFTGSFSEKNNNKYKFNDNYRYALGYNSVPYKRIYTVGANYQLPLFYPDFGLTFAYLLRLRLHAFFNYSRAKLFPISKNKTSTYRSAGLTLFLDTKIFNINIPIGLRVSRLLDTDPGAPKKNYDFNISFPVDLF